MRENFLYYPPFFYKKRAFGLNEGQLATGVIHRRQTKVPNRNGEHRKLAPGM